MKKLLSRKVGKPKKGQRLCAGGINKNAPKIQS